MVPVARLLSDLLHYHAVAYFSGVFVSVVVPAVSPFLLLLVLLRTSLQMLFYL